MIKSKDEDESKTYKKLTIKIFYLKTSDNLAYEPLLKKKERLFSDYQLAGLVKVIFAKVFSVNSIPGTRSNSEIKR